MLAEDAVLDAGDLKEHHESRSRKSLPSGKLRQKLQPLQTVAASHPGLMGGSDSKGARNCADLLKARCEAIAGQVITRRTDVAGGLMCIACIRSRAVLQEAAEAPGGWRGAEWRQKPGCASRGGPGGADCTGRHQEGHDPALHPPGHHLQGYPLLCTHARGWPHHPAQTFTPLTTRRCESLPVVSGCLVAGCSKLLKMSTSV